MGQNSQNIQCHCEPVTDVTGVALSKDSLRSQSPGSSENFDRTRRGRCPHRPETKACAYTVSAPIKPPIATRNISPSLRRSGRGILKGAAFRQRPLSRLLLNVLAGTRTLPPEEPEPKYSVNLGTAGTTYYDNPSVSRLRGTREPPLHYGTIATGNC